ncbi:MAG TPA: hypothetical protein RMH99_30140 [Sandaracinaceae bacterium LLY-WYZ-13_1]|nr:hypothetical protein [Sandaracinaceae bacterium LLY-WYZ-13_1]
MRRASLLLLAALLARPAPADGQSRMCSIEYIFGATNVHAITGHGRMSVGVSEEGDVTVLTWPSPSYSDQIAYVSSNALDARTLPRLGAQEGMGVFLGLVVEQDGARSVTWLRDEAWETTQGYGPDDGANVHTTHRSEALGLTVAVVDAVHPERDQWVREVRVERAIGSPVDAAWLLTYANLSPVPPSSRIPELPVSDWAYDGRNDYAAVWDPDARQIVHFHPGDRRIYDEPTDLVGAMDVDFGPVGEALVAGTPDDAALRSLIDGLDAAYAPGATLVLSTEPAPDQVQVGYDATPVCDQLDDLATNVLALPERWPGFELPLDPSILDALRCDRSAPSFRETLGWTHEAADALADAADGELSGSPIAADEVNEALRTPLTFEAGVAEARVVLGAGATLADARAALDAADPATVAAASDAALDEWLAGIRLPESSPARVREVARRSMINLRVGTDAGTGAVVASISRQPPYGLDWPRDGAFFNVAFDVSGQHALVAERNALYGEWQRDEPVRPTLLVDPDPPPPPGGGRARDYPADAWEMNYYADGEVGGLFRFEIDNTAFVLWAIVAHAGWSEDPEGYLRARWDTIRRAADLLVAWRDAETGLHWPAQEDDHAAYTQTLNGAVPVYGGLEMAARAARLLGEDEAVARWERRAAEVRRGILTHLWDEDAERFVKEVDGTARPDASGPTGTTAWLVWPARVLPFDDPRVRSQLESDLSFIEPQIRLETVGGQYFMKNTVSFGLTLGREPVFADRLAGLRDAIAETHATGTGHFGECMRTVEVAGTPVASQRVANPHLWEGALFYLTAMAMEDPDALLAYDEVLPEARVDEVDLRGDPMGPMDDGGCAAAPRPSPADGAPWLLVLLGLALAARAARRG